MKNIVKELNPNHDDFFIEEELVDKTAIYLIGFNTLVDLTKSKSYVQQMADSSTSLKALLTNLSDRINVDTEQIITAVLEGKLVIVSKDGDENALIDPIALL
ncbi:hypothetical protein [Fictibacillus terranigra]|uniref:Uncharacterized protein n=2 Tax=Fictibacillus TaxID=1329200 RepID=A0ABT8E1F1_9BACL|nr:hypothetical protein [Fictibacillus sp. CENA-BCM004]MDN4071738.1 hypothetical protein [Fictibacillus sp. CENA-BCM004]